MWHLLTRTVRSQKKLNQAMANGEVTMREIAVRIPQTRTPTNVGESYPGFKCQILFTSS
jgi:hypothetical protein